MEIHWHDGPREPLRPLFELAEDSATELDRYLPLGRVLVATDGGAVVGHLQLIDSAEPATLELQSMAVAESHQRRGIGGALVTRAVSEARASGAATLLAATATADIDNLRFYQRQGFRLLRVERDAFTAEHGYPDDLDVDGIPLRDRIWLSLAL